MVSGRSEIIKVLGITIMAFITLLVLPHLSFAGGSDLGNTFNTLRNNFSTLLFNYVGRVLFVVLFFIGLLVIPKNFTLAMIIIAIAILLAVGPTIANEIWNYFSSGNGTGGSGFIINHTVKYADLLTTVVV